MPINGICITVSESYYCTWCCSTDDKVASLVAYVVVYRTVL
jgi:hypothetical protein